jgi:hypothetical protein
MYQAKAERKCDARPPRKILLPEDEIKIRSPGKFEPLREEQPQLVPVLVEDERLTRGYTSCPLDDPQLGAEALELLP